MKKFIILFFLFSTSAAHSKVLLEPILGFGVKTGHQDIKPADFSIIPGLRVGVTMSIFDVISVEFISIGVEISHQEMRAEFSGRDRFLKRTDYNLFIVLDFPVFFRIFAKSIIHSNFDIGSTKIPEPSSHSIGVSYRILPLTSLNLEYRNISWNKIKIGDNERQREGKISELVLSVSLPLKLPWYPKRILVPAWAATFSNTKSSRSKVAKLSPLGMSDADITRQLGVDARTVKKAREWVCKGCPGAIGLFF